MPPRDYSDEHAHNHASPYHQERVHNYSHSHGYRDSPARDIISPPPGYASPEPPDSPLASSPSHAFLDHSHDYSQVRNSAREQLYTDDTPPLPPPHSGLGASGIGANPNRFSMSRRPIANNYAGVDDRDRDYSTERGRGGIYSQDNGMNSATQLQPHPGVTAIPMQDHSRGSSPFRQPQRPTSQFPERNSYSSANPFAGGSTPGSITPARTPDARSSRLSERSIPLTEYSSRSQRPIPAHYSNMPYYNSSHDFDPTISNASINPHNIVDDGDDGFMPDPQRRSVLSLGRSRSRAGNAAFATPAGVAGASIPGTQANGSRNNVVAAQDGADIPNSNEKSVWLSKQTGSNRRMRLWVGLSVGLVILLAIVGAIVGAVLGTRSASSNSGHGNINNAADDTAQNGDLDINSAEIKGLMNNKNLHKVFPGIDYTPWGVQYPACLTYPPSQNNVTRDMAVLSQLTNTVRLYGTDCNQTEMVLHAIDRLQLKNMKLWLGVWIDTNQTTTDRQMSQMYKLLDEIKDHSILKGVIIGNEALFRAGETKADAQQELITLLSNTRQNFTSLNYNLPIGTSDLGDNWDSTITQASDFVMSNIHPFFAGVSAEVAASWTWTFWQQHDAALTAGDTNKQQIISETGWPSDGGTDCGGTDGSCASGQSGATASIDNMNTYMNDWVCQALANGTEYFWFEAFDEPWKVQYNTPGREWEDKWGLMDAGRNLKSGVKIPDCGGKTV